MLLHGVRWITGRPVHPLAFHHPGAAPADPQRWRDAFGCPVHFGSAQCRIEIAVDDLALPIPTADPTVADLCGRIATQIAEQQGVAG